MGEGSVRDYERARALMWVVRLLVVVLALIAMGCGGGRHAPSDRVASERASAFLAAWLSLDVQRAVELSDGPLRDLVADDMDLQRRSRFQSLGRARPDERRCRDVRAPEGGERVVAFRLIGGVHHDAGGYYRPFGTLCITVDSSGKVRATNFFGGSVPGKRIPKIWPQ